MKDLIIIVGTIILGCIIFNLIAGNANSIKSASKSVMENTIKMYQDKDSSI